MASNESVRIYELQVRLAADSLRSLQKLQGSADKAEAGMARLSSSLKNLGIAGAIAASINMTTKAFMALVDEMDNAYKASQKLGLSTEAFTGLSYAAQLAGVETDAFTQSMTKLNVQLADVEKGAGDAAKWLRSFGVTGKDSPEEALNKIADGFAKMEDGANKTAAAVAIFGKQGAAVIPMLNAGAAGLSDMRKEAERLGVVIGTDAAKQAELFNDNMSRMAIMVKGAGMAITNELLPALTKASNEFVNGMNNSKGFFDALIRYGLTNPFKDLPIRIRETSNEIDRLQYNLDVGRIVDPEAIKKAQARIEDLSLTLKGLKAQMATETPGATAPPKLPALPNPAETAGKSGKLTELQQFVADALKAQQSAALLEPKLTALYNLRASGQIDNDTFYKLWQNLTGLGKAAQEALTPLQQYEQQLLDNEKVSAMFADKLKILDTLYLEGKIGLQAYIEGQKQLGVTTAETSTKTSEQLTGMDKLGAELGAKMDGYGKQMASSLVDIALGSEDAGDAFSKMATSMLTDMAKMATQILIMEPIMKSFEAMLRGTSGGSKSGGFNIGSLITSALSWLFLEKGGVFQSPSLSKFSGQVYDQPKMFAFAKGAGVFAEAGPEAIMPLSRGPDGKLGVESSGSGGDMIVIINNESKAEVTAGPEKTNADGQRVIELMVRDAVGRGFSSGSFDSLMGATYGLQRRGAY